MKRTLRMRILIKIINWLAPKGHTVIFLDCVLDEKQIGATLCFIESLRFAKEQAKKIVNNSYH